MANKHACQICGGKFGLKVDGTIRLHHRRSVACPGTGHRPFADACDAIDNEITRLVAVDAYWTAWWNRYYAGNRPPLEGEPAATVKASKDLERMRRRRKAWDRRDWIEYYDGNTGTMKKRPPDQEAA